MKVEKNGINEPMCSWSTNDTLRSADQTGFKNLRYFKEERFFKERLVCFMVLFSVFSCLFCLCHNSNRFMRKIVFEVYIPVCLSVCAFSKNSKTLPVIFNLIFFTLHFGAHIHWIKHFSFSDGINFHQHVTINPSPVNPHDPTGDTCVLHRHLVIMLIGRHR